MTLNLDFISSKEQNLLMSDKTIGSEEKCFENIIQEKKQSFLESTTTQEFAKLFQSPENRGK